MAYTLADLTYYTAVQLGVVIEGTVTAGTTKTVTDTVDRTEDDDDWNGGTIWLRYDAGGVGAAPQGEMDEITDFANGTSTITVRTGFTVAPSVGDQYAIAKGRYSKQILVQAVNQALRRIDAILLWDSTSLSTASSQTEYTLPAMVTKENLLEVYVQLNDDDSDDNRWRKMYNWYVQETSTGTEKTLILPYQPSSGYALGLSYTGKHPVLRTYDDELNESVPIERVIYAAAYEALLRKRRNADAITADKIVRAQQEMLVAERDNPINIPPQSPKIVMPRMLDDVPDDEVDKVYLA